MYIHIILKEYIHTYITNIKTPLRISLCPNHQSNVNAYKENLIEELKYSRVKHLVEKYQKTSTIIAS